MGVAGGSVRGVAPAEADPESDRCRRRPIHHAHPPGPNDFTQASRAKLGRWRCGFDFDVPIRPVHANEPREAGLAGLGAGLLGGAVGGRGGQSLRYIVTTQAPPNPRLCWRATLALGT
jgi:hypothetical protein